jgi:plastocyanin
MAAYAAVNARLTLPLQVCGRRAACAKKRLSISERGRAMSLDAAFRTRHWVAVALAAALIVGLGTLVGLALPQNSISQKGREFHPGDIAIKRGETIEIVNDDGDLLHHAYVDSPKFSFDSGDQEPGSKTDITFPVAGDFDVLCAIHPKMRLAVHVK